jgi:hypothetical protein
MGKNPTSSIAMFCDWSHFPVLWAATLVSQLAMNPWQYVKTELVMALNNSLTRTIMTTLSKEINGKQTEVLLQRFADRCLVLVTQMGKVGNLVLTIFHSSDNELNSKLDPSLHSCHSASHEPPR